MNRFLSFALIISLVILGANLGVAGNFSNIMMLHHSTGNNLINQGGVRSLIAAYNTAHGTNLEFWDHGYNADGVHNQSGSYFANYNIPNDNTNPDGLYALFMLPINNPPDNALSRFLLAHPMGVDTVTHDVFIFKSCFPASDISSEQMLTDYQNWYLAMRTIMDAHPEKIFIPFTPPPLVRSATTTANAARAQRFADWLTSSTYLSGHPNIIVFDFRHYLMEHDSTSIYYNCLREVYGGAGSDSHPNLLANQTVAPIFVTFLTDAITAYQNLQGLDPEDIGLSIPGKLSILGNYPNPFNSSTIIEYSLSSAGEVTIDIFDILGRNLKSVPIGLREAGRYSYNWQANGLSSGTYIFRIGANNSFVSKKILYLK